MAQKTRPGTFRLMAGGLLILLGLALNPWVLAALFTFDGQIESRLVVGAIVVADLVLVGLGVGVLRRRGAGPRRPRAANVALSVVVLLLSLAAAEAAVRVLGYTPWDPGYVAPRISPGDSYYRLDPDLGYTHRPGRFTVTLPATGYAFTTTHRADALRITAPQDTAAVGTAPGRPGLWIFGGSITHGWSLDDAQSYPWLVQEALPGHEVVNFGMSGYGTLHAWIQLGQALAARQPPDVVVLAYASMHDARNTFAREWRKTIVPRNRLEGLRHPAARLDGADGFDHRMVAATYRAVPLMQTSALVHLAEKAYNRIEERGLHSHEVSWAIIRAMHEAARAQGARFIVAGILPDPKTAAMLERCRAAGIDAVDIGVDLNVEGHRNLPHDSHPSASAHRHYADTLVPYIKDILSQATVSDG